MNSIAVIHLALCQALFDASWSCVLLAGLAWLLFKLTPRQSATTRHNLGMLVLSAMLVFPLVRFFQVLTFPPLSNTAAKPTATLATSSLADLSTLSLPQANLPELPVYLAWLWLTGVILMLLRLSSSYLLLRRWQQQLTHDLAPEWQLRFAQLCQRMALTRRVSLGILRDSLEPWSAHVLRPVVAIPQRLFREFSETQLIAILAHELAHIKRYDWLWNGWQCLVEAVLFFHPGVWYVSRQIRAEREHACDDVAIQAGVAPLVLAEALTRLAQLRQADNTVSPKLALASYAQGQHQEVSAFGLRIRRLLLPRSPATLSRTLLLTTLCFALGLFASPWLIPQSHALSPIQSAQLTYPVNLKTADGIPTPPLPALPPLPESPAEAPLPPPPPLPPAFPSLEKLEIFKDINSKLNQDQRVIEQLGQPINIAQQGVGRIYIKEWWFEPGQTEARLSINVAGPNGKGVLQVYASRPAQNWQFKVLKLESNNGTTQIDLLNSKS